MISLGYGDYGSLSGGSGNGALRVTQSACLYGPVVRLYGRLERGTVLPFRRWLARHAPAGAPAVVLNLDGLERLDADGLAALAAVSFEWQRAGVHPILVAGRAEAAEQLTRSGIADRVLATLTETAAFEVLDSLLGEGSHPTAEPSQRPAALPSRRAA